MAPSISLSQEATYEVIQNAHQLYARAGLGGDADERPPSYKIIGVCLAVASGFFIGVSFIFSKKGLLKANEKYDEIPGEGYGYLKNVWWWGGMSLMVIGEICNFVAYAFTDAILVACLGALSVVVATVLSAIFLKERLSAVGIVGCVLCILGSVSIALNIPSSSAVKNIEEMQDFVLKPGILVYGGIVILACLFIAIWCGPRYGNKNVLVYLSICSLIGGLSVVATQGLGSSILAAIGGRPQFNQWFMYVLLAFVIVTLLVELLYLNKALNIFNAALVTPTYYVTFTSATIITSAILFRGFKGTPVQIITVIMGFLTICAGVVLLQLSKSAKDVPDAAVFAGDLDQIRTIVEQEQPETEPKADALRGTASIVRRLSAARQKMELAEAKRLHEDMQAEHLAPLGENEAQTYEWDGIRRRRTTLGSHMSHGHRPHTPHVSVYSPSVHPPLGMSYFPTEQDDHDDDHDHSRPVTGHTFGGGFLGSIRDRARSIVVRDHHRDTLHPDHAGQRSPMHPMPLTDISHHYTTSGNSNFLDPNSPYPATYTSSLHEQKTAYEPHASHSERPPLSPGRDPRRDTFGNFSGLSGLAASVAVATSVGGRHAQHLSPTRPGEAKRQFSFTNFFSGGGSKPQHEEDYHTKRQGLGSRGTSASGKLAKAATEEERAGLVKGDSRTELESVSDVTGKFPEFVEEDSLELEERGWGKEEVEVEDKPPVPPKHGKSRGQSPIKGRMDTRVEKAKYDEARRKWEGKGSKDGSGKRESDGRGGNGPAYI